MNTSRNTRNTYILLLACCFALSFFAPAGSYASTTTQQISLSQEQWTKYKLTLETLVLKLEQLEKNSDRDKTELKQLKEQLTESQNAMEKTQHSLTIASDSLTTLEANIQTLKTQIEKKQQENKRLKRQRDTWAVVAGLLAAIAAVK